MEGFKDYKKIIEDYLNGIYSPEGERIFNEWYDSFNDEKSKSFTSEQDKSRIKAEIFQRIKSGIREKEPKRHFLPRKLPKISLRIAAVLVGFIIVASVAFILFKNSSQVEYTTDYGQKLRITLPDKSVVMLNSNSSVKYAKAWSVNSPREIWLAGEAFFEVEKIQGGGRNTQFIVHTDNVHIKVLGTTFNVRNRRGETKVVLNTGKVRLGFKNNDNVITMKPGEMVEYAGAGEKLTKKLVDPEVYNAWLNNQLIFEDTELEEIARTLEDIYGYKVEIEDKTLSKERFKGKFPTNKLKILIGALEASFDLDIAAKDKTITIKRRS